MTEPLLKHSRLPRKYEAKAATEAGKILPYAPLKGTDPQDLINRYMTNETTYSIAESYGVSLQALSAYLLRHAESDWKEAQVMRAIARKETAEDSINSANDPLALAKARESLKAAQWDLERTCRRIYGEERQVQDVIQPILNITINQATEQLKQPPFARVEYAHAPDVQPQQYDSGAPQQEAVIDAPPVDK